MNHLIVTFVLLAAFATTVQSEPIDATPGELLEYKERTKGTCIADAVAEGTKPSQAASFCTCSTDYVWKTAPPADLQAAYQHHLQGSRIQELKVFSPTIRNGARECKAWLSP